MTPPPAKAGLEPLEAARGRKALLDSPTVFTGHVALLTTCIQTFDL